MTVTKIFGGIALAAAVTVGAAACGSHSSTSSRSSTSTSSSGTSTSSLDCTPRAFGYVIAKQYGPFPTIQSWACVGSYAKAVTTTFTPSINTTSENVYFDGTGGTWTVITGLNQSWGPNDVESQLDNDVAAQLDGVDHNPPADASPAPLASVGQRVPPATTSSSSPTISTTTTPTTTTSPAASSLPLFSIPPVNGSGGYSGRYPTMIGLSVDGGNIISGISWTSWEPEQAVGHGTWTAQNCVPDCASGSETPYPATITLSNPANGVYTTLTEVTSGPYGSTTVYTYGSQNWAQSAQ
jgi:hypothetical protein